MGFLLNVGRTKRFFKSLIQIKSNRTESKWATKNINKTKLFSESFREIAFKFRIKNPQMCVIWHIDEIYMRIIQIKMSIRWLYRKKKTNTYEQGLEVLTATSIAFLSRFLFSVFYFFFVTRTFNKKYLAFWQHFPYCDF